MPAESFADRFVAAARRLDTPLCVGLDPHLERVPKRFGVRPDAPASAETADGVLAFAREVLAACADRVAVVKPQIAFFEQLGWRGIEVLEKLSAHCRERGLLVLLDAKRGDIGSTAAAYARAYLAPGSPSRADAITLNPYLGLDSLEPFGQASRDHGVGLFVLARTSNAGAHDFQSRRVEGGAPLYETVASALAPLAESLVGASGFSTLGVVAGATYPEEARRLRAILPRSLFLVPGYGAQGAPVSQALASFVTRGGRLEGGLINSSRAILYPREGEDADVTTAVAARIDAANAELRQAIVLPRDARDG